MSALSPILYGVLLPALVAGLVLLFGGRGSPDEWKPRALLGAVAFGLGYLIAHVMLTGMPPVPSASVQVPGQHWIAWFVAGAIALAPFRRVAAIQRWSGPLYLALFCVLSFRFPLQNILSNEMGHVALRFGLTLVMYMVWNATDRLASQSRGFALPAGLIVAGTGIALSALLAAHSAALAQLVGAACASLGAAAVVGLIDKQFRLPVGAVSIVLIVYAGALVNASIYDLPKSATVLLVAAIVAPWISETRKFKDASPWKRAIVAGISAAIPAAIATLIAWNAGDVGDSSGY